MEYGDISLKRLVSVYKEAYQKAGFKVTVKKDSDQNAIHLNMKFLSSVNSKKQKASRYLSIFPGDEQITSNKCMPCSVIGEASEADSEELEQQMNQAIAAAHNQIKKKLQAYIWYDPADWVSPFYTTYDRVSVLDFISAYKKAYEALGFEQEDVLLNKDEDGNQRRYLIFKLTNTGNLKFKASSLLWVELKKSYWCDPCLVIREPRLSVETALTKDEWNSLSDNLKEKYLSAESALDKELREKDEKARKLAEVKLAKYLRVRPCRDITNNRR